ncbi:hypothetical protein MGAST_04370 [Mycobacterium gastri 'Wayne']|nr:hypothetical protein MGAST_04370 [Mycobacterium gastri 'Wayne']
MNDQLLGGLVQSQELAQVMKGDLASCGVRRLQYVVEHVVDQIVLSFEKLDHFLWRLDKHFGHAGAPPV